MEIKQITDRVALLKERISKKLKPVVIYEKQSGQIMQAFYSTKIDEIQKVDRRTYDVLELDSGILPQNIRACFIVNGILKQKSEKILNQERVDEFEVQITLLETQLKAAKKSKLEGAVRIFTDNITKIKLQIKNLGVE